MRLKVISQNSHRLLRFQADDDGCRIEDDSVEVSHVTILNPDEAALLQESIGNWLSELKRRGLG